MDLLVWKDVSRNYASTKTHVIYTNFLKKREIVWQYQ